MTCTSYPPGVAPVTTTGGEFTIAATKDGRSFTAELSSINYVSYVEERHRADDRPAERELTLKMLGGALLWQGRGKSEQTPMEAQRTWRFAVTGPILACLPWLPRPVKLTLEQVECLEPNCWSSTDSLVEARVLGVTVWRAGEKKRLVAEVFAVRYEVLPSTLTDGM